MSDDPGQRVEPGRQGGGVVKRPGEVRDDAIVGARRRVAQDNGPEARHCRGEPEAEQLDGHRSVQRRNGLGRVDDHDEAVRRAGHDLLSGMGPTPALDQPTVRAHLVRAIDRHVEVREGERLDSQPEGGRQLLGRGRRGHAPHGEGAFGQCREEKGDRRPGPETERHPVLHQARGRLGGDPFLGIHLGAHGPRMGRTSARPQPGGVACRISRRARQPGWRRPSRWCGTSRGVHPSNRSARCASCSGCPRSRGCRPTTGADRSGSR